MTMSARVRKPAAAFALCAFAFCCVAPGLARAQSQHDDAETFGFHGQATIVEQGNLAFASPYAAANSLPGKAEGRETVDLTLFVGVRPWRGAELWVDPEFDQGFGLHNTLGVAGFPSGEAYKVGRDNLYFRVQRLFLRQTIRLGGATTTTEPDANQLAGRGTANNLVLTVGKFAVTDVFDANAYAHNSKGDFLNWSLIDAGTFDYAADAWGYSVGASAELTVGDWTWRAGLFDLSDVPNSAKLDPKFGQFQALGEIERRYQLAGRGGAIKVTGFLSRARMARYADAIAYGQDFGEPPSLAPVRRYRSRAGVSIDLQQALNRYVGLFARAGWASADVEPYEFADIDRTISAGVSIRGSFWRRPADTFGFAGVVNGISAVHQAYFAAGGQGILIGDGRLPHPSTENILETYYDAALTRFLHMAVDYQFVDHPAYNTERGPVSIFAARIHAEF